ncbi:penicillin-binding protein 2 [Mucilaginibacter myungsuensis]|uniref:Penicillin-binding protein 2 n=1 Tax=Mucilaginibacter myungsuensis TaxID=649104 RepID=A0A929KXI8_9SPHI|nr:penicillin-binding protein 2 [Mucilaginibacter myungsuensis]MBE9663476.1 penicillin-binding protein 2 [Mucilaginibacter myungsuensis]MDN3600214.1 penicillin-binding protein 2 [Mucilaginibacter myungsuensis]
MNSFFARRYVVTIIFVVIALVLLARLFYLQIVDEKYILLAKNNVVRTRIVFPARGPIKDRNGIVLVENQPVYDIMVTPKQVKPFDTLALCDLLGIDMKGFRLRLANAKIKNGVTRATVFEGQLSGALYASLQERLYEFPGFDVQLRSVRSYPDSIAAHFLGYTDEVKNYDIEKHGGYYHPGDYIGRTGVESSYEEALRGQRGVQNLMVDNKGIPKGRFANGAYDTAAVAGEQLISSLDSRIQKLGEHLMQNKVGSIVAIEPSSGEILAFVSTPGYNPNLMVGRNHGNHYMDIQNSPNHRLMIRPIQATYPPGSSFKPLSALIALQEGVITKQTTYLCPGRYLANNGKPKCTHVHGLVNLSSAIAESCNGYFAMVYEKLINARGAKATATSLDYWASNVNKFGLGVKLGVDLNGEKRGRVPTSKLYNKFYPNGQWRSKTILSNAIGQGEVEATMLQLANVECAIANRGFFYTPHLIKAIGDKKVIKPEFTVKHDVGVDAQYFEQVILGMQQVVDYGTARASKIPGIIMCGKTGTAQNSDHSGKNHSVFVAFAPRDTPKIAIAVIVENSGDGGTYAAPIASFMVEQYLRGKITPRDAGPGFSVDYYSGLNLMPQPKVKAPVKPLSPKDSIKQKLIDSAAMKQRAPKSPANRSKPITIAMLPKKEDRK